ncbi:UNVERIFIED_CONTAM: hypothetical protein HDU68_009487 [Siphonaria sp. JEL0065]|nr:hypothetical protein HDU68_009487 [Siphonaria sp. JEL0065]
MDFSTASRFKPAVSNKTVRYHLSKTPIVIAYNQTANRVHIVPCSTNLSAMELLSQTHKAILSCFQKTKYHPHRFIYCVAGRLFFAAAPLPFGGPRISPGFADFEGKDAEELLAFIISGAYKVYWNLRGRSALEAVVESVNNILDWHMRGMKDDLDELCLKGLKKAGHIEWFGGVDVPKHLRSYLEEGEKTGVLFTPKLGRMEIPVL